LFFYVIDPPVIVVSPQHVVISEGQRLMLFCNVSGQPSPNITWYKVGGNLTGQGDTFTISNVSKGDEGSYRCVVNNVQECYPDSSVASVIVNRGKHSNQFHCNSYFRVALPWSSSFILLSRIWYK